MCGRAIEAAVTRKRRDTYPELGEARRCRLVVVGVQAGGFGAEAAQCPLPPDRHQRLGSARSARTPPRCSSSAPPPSSVKAQSLTCMSSGATQVLRPSRPPAGPRDRGQERDFWHQGKAFQLC